MKKSNLPANQTDFLLYILLDGNALDRKNLYVALTRASRSLTILSTSPVLDPQ